MKIDSTVITLQKRILVYFRISVSSHCSKLTDSNITHISSDIPRTLVGETVVVKCMAGYVMIGDSVLSCNDKGTWSNPLPKCIKYGR